jgi:hypothetical protein
MEHSVQQTRSLTWFICEEHTSPVCQWPSEWAFSHWSQLRPSAVRVAGLRWSLRCRSRLWRFWAGVVTSHLRLWDQLDVLPNSLKQHGREINIQFSDNSSHAPSKLETSVGFFCLTKLHILKWAFIVLSTRCTCVMIMLFNQLLDMPHLSGVWIILAKEKCLITGM